MWGVTLQKPGPVLPCEVTVRGGSPRPGSPPLVSTLQPHLGHSSLCITSETSIFTPGPSQHCLLLIKHQRWASYLPPRGCFPLVLSVDVSMCGLPGAAQLVVTSCLQRHYNQIPAQNHATSSLLQLKNSFHFSQFLLKMNVFLCFSLFYCNTCKHETKT